MQEQLEAIGLTELQAKAYLYLLSYSAGRKPTHIAEALAITRTNAYKVLDQLCEFDLARRSSTEKTYHYYAENPIALTSFVSEARNKALELEKTVKDSLGALQKHYQRTIRHSEVRTGHGKSAILQAYAAQTKNDKAIHFVRSRHDTPFMGFDIMDKVRRKAKETGQLRYGITPVGPEAPVNPEIDEKSNLTRTLVPSSSYTSPVEWSVSGDELAIISFTDAGSAIRIKDHVIAESFRELWYMLDDNIHANPNHKTLSDKAGRKY